MIKEFVDYMRYEQRLSEGTIEGYTYDLKVFVSYMKKVDTGITWGKVTSGIIRSWVVDMSKRNIAASTICRRLACINSAYRFAISHNYLTENPVRFVTTPKKQKPLPKCLSIEEMQSILNLENWKQTNYKSMITHAMLLTMFHCGLRISEVVSLRMSDIDLRTQTVSIMGKGCKERRVPMTRELIDEILYLRRLQRGTVGESDYIFASDVKEHIIIRTARNQITAAIYKYTGRTNVGPHAVRHAFATALLRGGASTESIRKMLGHTSLNTTQIYLNLDMADVEKDYNRCFNRRAV